MNRKFTKDLSTPDPIPEAGMARVQALMESGRIHRYGEANEDELDVLMLERDYAQYMGTRYCTALNSCGCGLFVALKCVGVEPGDAVLTNAFTLAPVPGAIAHCNAKPVLVEITGDYTTDLADLRQKAEASGAKVLLLSHMRGHIVNMESVADLCDELGITLVEDCAHTMGASWRGRLTGTFGTVGVFSTQTFKHMNSGEGGLLVTDDEDIAAKSVLYSGSYMLYHQHGARPDEAVFDRWRGVIPNFSMRMTNVAAAMLRPQLALLAQRAEIWNRRYDQLAERLAEIPHIQLPHRPPDEEYVASSIQFSVHDLTMEQMQRFQAYCGERGVLLKWFGHPQAVGFTSAHHHWEYVAPTELTQTDAVLHGLFDMRIPLNLTDEDVESIGAIIYDASTSSHQNSDITPPQPPPGVIAHRDLAYVTDGHERQKLDLYLPEAGENHPLIIWIHGGAFRKGSKEGNENNPLAFEYVVAGYALASINYRLSQHAIFPAQIEDCKAAVRWLRAHATEYNLDPRRFAAWGPSAGGHLASMLGTTGHVSEFEVGEHLYVSSHVQCAVDYFGPTDFLQMDDQRLPDGMIHNEPDSPESELIGGPIQEYPEKTARANPITYIIEDMPPFLIIHGNQDPLVPHGQSVLLVQALQNVGADVTFYTVEGGEHGRFTDPHVPELTRVFFGKHLKDPIHMAIPIS